MTLSRDELDRLYRHALALTGAREEAEDLLQSCLAEWLSRPEDLVVAPVAYLRQMLRSRFIDAKRRGRIVRFEPIEAAEALPDPQQGLEQLVVDEATLEQAWALLDPPEREVLYLWAFEGLSAAEIALQLQQPRGSILSRMHRARQKIQRQFPAQAGGGEHG